MIPPNNSGLAREIGHFIKRYDSVISKVLARSFVAVGTVGAITALTGAKAANIAMTATATTIATLAGAASAKVLPKNLALPLGIGLYAISSHQVTFYPHSSATIMGEIWGYTAGVLSETGHTRFEALSKVSQKARLILLEADKQLCANVTSSVTAFADYLIDAPPPAVLPY